MHFSRQLLLRAAPFVRPRRPRRVKIQLKSQGPSSSVNQIVIKPKAKHPALQDGFSGHRLIKNLCDLYLRDDVVSALEEVGVSKPTVVQMLAIPKIARGKNVLCASETGSGKTLAYLAPLVSRLKDEEDVHGVLTRLNRPRALIVLPSRDLAAQVLRVAKSLCHQAKFRAIGLIGGMKRKFIRDALLKPVDLVVATPESLLMYRQQERVLLSDVSHLVLDEADTLFDNSFKKSTMSIINAIKLRPKKPPLPPARAEGAQVTLVGATFTEDVLNDVESLIPNLKKVSSKHLHQVLPHVEQKFVTVRQEEKADELVSLINSHPTDILIVFCNTVRSCDWTTHNLKSHNIDMIKLHGGFSAVKRKNLLKEFQEGDCKVLVCTDIASRGIDTSKVNHIVLFDFPLNMPDYLHRVGRTGRVGSLVVHPRVTAFMTHRKDVRMALEIRDAASRQEAVMDRKVVRAILRERMDKTETESHAVG